MKRRIFFHGPLRALVGPDPIELEATTVAEAIKRASLQLPGLKPNAVTGRHRLQVVGYDTVESLFTEGEEEIHVVPQFCGAKNGGIFEVLLGAVLIGASFLTAGTSLAFLGPMMMQAGAVLVLAGILSLLQTPPQATRTHYLGSPQNTVAIGTPIALAYGHCKVGGQLLSVNIEAVNVSAPT